jgi:carboxypeptidase family protein/TonB-dependent receptor-like protein
MIRCHPLSLTIRYLVVSAFLFVTCHALLIAAFAQSASATLSGTVEDTNGAVIPGVSITVINNATGARRQTTTNAEGYFVVPLLPPSRYQITAQNQGFTTVRIPEVVLNVGDQKALQIQLKAGDINATVQVVNEAPLIDESPAVGTVVDRQFAENLPMNGRSFQTLVQMTPGVVVTPVSAFDGGQFSVNGQRASSNYWTVDGVGANIGVSATSFPGNGSAGALGSFSVLGGTNSLVSVDALQEFRIQTSSYAPEFGRTPGAQISIVTRPGTNHFHGSLFDYLRNDVFDANNWFANSVGLPKAKERQNDFGGTFSGPIVKERTFFFFSYEGLRLRLPQTTLTTVPDVTARQGATPALQPFLNVYPLPNGADNVTTHVAQLNLSFSNPATLDAYSVRVDHRLGNAITLFGRYNYSPSEFTQRAASSLPLSGLLTARVKVHTATAAATWIISPILTNDLRFNYSRTDASSRNTLDSFGGAVPLTSPPLPSPFTTDTASFSFSIFSLSHGTFAIGPQSHNRQRQINLVDNLSLQRGSHGLKFGVDYRRLSPEFEPRLYSQQPAFFSVAAAAAGSLGFTFLTSQVRSNLLFRNVGAFVQDTWRVSSRFTLTYGLRWDLDVAPSSLNGPSLPAVTGFSRTDFSQLALAPAGTPPFKTTYGNFAPRLGVAYQLRRQQGRETMIRGGFGVFYDLATSEVGNAYSTNYPFGASSFFFGGTFPLSSGLAAPPPITVAQLQTGTLSAVDPNLTLPYTLQWNLSIEQAVGRQQSLSASYVGAAGRRLIQTANISSPNPRFGFANLVANTGTSNYQAMQLEFQRRLSHGLQALASYTWAHSIDTGSAGSIGLSSNAFVPSVNSATNRGPSDFDIRHAFSAGVTYNIPTPRINSVTKAVLRGWSLETIVQARSAPPVDASDQLLGVTLFNAQTAIRPDLVPGIPLYLYGPQYPGGRILNNTPNQGGPGCVGPFCPPPTGAGGVPLRQGNIGRNALRGFGAMQWDLAVHRDFAIHESLKLQFRAEMFNVLNHPNFGQPSGDISSPTFGRSTQMLGQGGLGNAAVSGTFNSLYQIGGPRSIQFALKLTF